MTKKKISKLFDNKVFWAVVSLLAALFIWVYITGTQEEPIEKSFSNVEVVFTGEDTLQASRGYVINNISAETVSVRISGTRRNIGSLTASDIKATIDVSLISQTGTITQYYTLTYPDGVDADAVSVVSSNPSVISFNVTRMSTKQVPVDVQFRGSTAEGYIAGEVEYEPKMITISGPESELEQIDHVYAEIGGDELTMTRTADVPFVLIDKSGNEVSSEGFEFDITTINVTIPISMVKEVTLYVQCIYGAGGTQQVTRHRVCRGDVQIVDMLAENACDGLQLGDVAQRGRGAVTIYVIDLFGLHTGILQRGFHRQDGALPLGMGSREVMCVGRCAAAYDFAVDFRSASFCVLVLLEDQCAGALADHESVAVYVERTRSVLRIVVTGRNGLHR